MGGNSLGLLSFDLRPKTSKELGFRFYSLLSYRFLCVSQNKIPQLQSTYVLVRHKQTLLTFSASGLQQQGRRFLTLVALLTPASGGWTGAPSISLRFLCVKIDQAALVF